MLISLLWVWVSFALSRTTRMLSHAESQVRRVIRMDILRFMAGWVYIVRIYYDVVYYKFGVVILWIDF